MGSIWGFLNFGGYIVLNVCFPDLNDGNNEKNRFTPGHQLFTAEVNCEN